MTIPTWLPGDPVPDFAVRSSNSAKFHFNTAAGRHIVLTFYGSAANDTGRAINAHIAAQRALFDDEHVCWFGISVDPDDERLARVAQITPGIRYFWDFDRAVSTRYGAVRGTTDGKLEYAPFTLVLDPMLRVLACIPVASAGQHAEALERVLARLPAPPATPAPVLVLPRVFEPEFCRQLIGLYERHGGTESGFMREVDGKTVGVLESSFKRRQDFTFDAGDDFEPLRAAVRARLTRRLVPEIRKAFQFDATRIERYIVACYDGAAGGFFRAHRDNTTPGTAHRRFACTINLNAEDYDGGELRFPEFGAQTYRAPTGGAVVFSCSLLHEATPVTRGRRYAFLPFLYDDAAAAIRARNQHTLVAAPGSAP
ncbi:AhpC/TSA family protein [Pseudoduganella flava]|uniref:AhpC/TSA family protein n=1 Tax=Pseudoduganella flava TaxID=871742 RepID=A0A562PKP3_9BURK|nr:2OG-Fe(II) oxygenase [Pseudoduganella flava]QGZ42433.1 redoxin domain-containing protein [Pseudoduganella flava]TWI44999.1 AhpC/TSA family protein [Pseudoduganella flava]